MVTAGLAIGTVSNKSHLCRRLDRNCAPVMHWIERTLIGYLRMPRCQRHDSAFEYGAAHVGLRTVIDGSTSFAWAKVGSSCPESPASSRAACAGRCA
jgi:hypothetical protein